MSAERLVIRTVGKGRELSTVSSRTSLEHNSPSSSVSSVRVEQTREEKLAARSRAAIEMRRRVVLEQKMDLMRRGLKRRSRRWSTENWTASLPVIWEEDGEDEEEGEEKFVKKNSGGRRNGGSKHVRSDSNDSVDGAFDLDVLLSGAKL